MLQVLGIVGALDPHTHKVNQANIQGEGKLEREGVRPQRQPDPTGLGGGAATTLGKQMYSCGHMECSISHDSVVVQLDHSMCI